MKRAECILNFKFFATHHVFNEGTMATAPLPSDNHKNGYCFVLFPPLRIVTVDETLSWLNMAAYTHHLQTVGKWSSLVWVFHKKPFYACGLCCCGGKRPCSSAAVYRYDQQGAPFTNTTDAFTRILVNNPGSSSSTQQVDPTWLPASVSVGVWTLCCVCDDSPRSVVVSSVVSQDVWGWLMVSWGLQIWDVDQLFALTNFWSRWFPVKFTSELQFSFFSNSFQWWDPEFISNMWL